MIKLLRDYRGILTDERLLVAGDYAETQLSPELIALLLSKNYAQQVGAIAEPFQDDSETGAIPYSIGIDIGLSEDTSVFSLVSADAEGLVIEETSLDIDALRKRYTELSLKKPYNGWNAETLSAKIEELEERES